MSFVNHFVFSVMSDQGFALGLCHSVESFPNGSQIEESEDERETSVATF